MTHQATMTAKYQTTINYLRFFVGLCLYMMHRFCCLCIGVCDIILNKLLVDYHHATGKSAKYGRILWRRKHFEMDITSQTDFVCFFVSRVNPDYVLRSNVSLYALTNKEAVFVETAENVNIYSSKVHPFFFVAQYLYAKTVIKMSITDFVSLAGRIGDPKVPVIWISNTGRCGGTMLSQVFESVPGTLLIQEPDPPLPLWYLQQSGALQASQYDALLKSAIRILCKPHQGMTMICIKPRPQCKTLMKDISRLQPNTRQIFMYRNSLNTIRSLVGMLHCEPFVAVLCSCANCDWFSKICPYFRQLERYYFTLKLIDCPDVPPDANTTCVFAFMWSQTILIARDAMSRDPNILPVRYEDIIAAPKEAVRQLFDSLEIDDIHVNHAVTSMERDSQRETVLSRDRVESRKCISRKDMIRIDAILSQFNLPLLGQDFRISEYKNQSRVDL